MNLYEERNLVIAEGLKDFYAKHILECGQCFRWKLEEDGSYTIVAKNRILNVKNDGDKVIFDNTNLKEFEEIWIKYFDLERDYGVIKSKLKEFDKYLDESTDFGWGIRLLQQDAWEMIISFIISSNNRIPMIQKAIKNLSEKFGQYIGEYKGEKYYSFPDIKSIVEAPIEEVRECRTGFRDKYIKQTSKDLSELEKDIFEYENFTTDECKEILLNFSGVGPKVCDCILLFGMQKYDTFPVDVWVKRVMEEFYVEENMSLPKIRKFAIDKFGDLSGFAQQYLFYYAREKGIGKKEKAISKEKATSK
jgi:N-glycosylase/DNA lyase